MIVCLFAIDVVLVFNLNPLTAFLAKVVATGLLLVLVLFFFYLAGRVYLKETNWS